MLSISNGIRSIFVEDVTVPLITSLRIISGETPKFLDNGEYHSKSGLRRYVYIQILLEVYQDISMYHGYCTHMLQNCAISVRWLL